MFTRIKEFLGNRENRPAILIVLFFTCALAYFLSTLGILRFPDFSSSEPEKIESISPTPSPTEEPTPTEAEEEEDDPTPTVRKFIPTSTPKPTATMTPAATSTPGPTYTPTPTVTPTPSGDTPTPTPTGITPSPTSP